MDRREFTHGILNSTIGAALSGLASGQGSTTKFKFSVMLWTVFTELPFEQRLEKVAEAGYCGVELVDEFKHWSETDFRMANAKKQQLGLTFDATAGVSTGVAVPDATESFQKDFSGLLQIAQRLECPSIIVLSGDRVEGKAREVQHAVCVDNLKWASDIAEKKGSIDISRDHRSGRESPGVFNWRSRSAGDRSEGKSAERKNPL
jgi:hydroxypyruvate isomerase